MTAAADMAKVAERWIDKYVAEVDAHAVTKVALAAAERDRDDAAARLQALAAELEAARRELAAEREQRATAVAAAQAQRAEDGAIIAALDELKGMVQRAATARRAPRPSAPVTVEDVVQKYLDVRPRCDTAATAVRVAVDALRGRTIIAGRPTKPPARAAPPRAKAARSRRTRS